MTGQWKHQVYINGCKKQPGRSISVLWWEFRPLDKMSCDSWEWLRGSGLLWSPLCSAPFSCLSLSGSCCIYVTVICVLRAVGPSRSIWGGSQGSTEGWLRTRWVPTPAVSSWSQQCGGPSSCILLAWTVIASVFCFWVMFPDAVEYLYHKLLNQITMFSLLQMSSFGLCSGSSYNLFSDMKLSLCFCSRTLIWVCKYNTAKRIAPKLGNSCILWANVAKSAIRRLKPWINRISV